MKQTVVTTSKCLALVSGNAIEPNVGDVLTEYEPSWCTVAKIQVYE